MLKYKYIHSILQQNKFNVPPLNEMWYSPNMDTINMEKKWIISGKSRKFSTFATKIWIPILLSQDQIRTTSLNPQKK